MRSCGEFGRYPNCFTDFAVCRAQIQCVVDMESNAVVALDDVGVYDRDQFLDFWR